MFDCVKSLDKCIITVENCGKFAVINEYDNEGKRIFAYKDKVYQMVYRVTSDRVTSGCVVQFHINGYHTAEVLDKALDNWINVKGLRPVTVGELMQLSGRDFPPLPDYGD